jgi:hypothetical protein
MLRQNLPDEELAVQNAVTGLIVRYRHWFFGFLALLLLASYNGQWRIGLDSSIYRGLAANLAAGNGFVFGKWATNQVYPGLPVMLAAVNQFFNAPIDATQTNNSAFEFVAWRMDTAVAIGLILLMGVATIVLSYKLIRLHYPQWMAICVAFGVGTNAWFLELSNEILTDIPFLFGVVAALYGWEMLKRAETRKQAAGAMLALAPGLVIAASTRPTFWVLALAWIVVCAWGVIRGPRRRFFAVCLVTLLAAWVLIQVLDPRERGINPFAGGYEREAVELLPDVTETFSARAYHSLRNQLPAAFFGEQLAPFSILASLILLGSSLLLIRRHPLWALMIFITFGITLVLSSQPRYYIMVLPMLLLAWLLMLCEIVRRLPKRAGEVVLFCGLALVTLNNLSASVAFIKDQRSPRFVMKYKDGKYVSTVKMCDIILDRVPRDGHVLAPSGSIMTYITGVHVFTQRELIPHGAGLHLPEAIHATNIRYAVFPARVYRVKQPLIARLVDRNLLIPTKKFGTAGDMWLARVQAIVPEGDWRELPKGWQPAPQTTRKPAATQPAERKRAPKTTKKPATKPPTRRAPTRSDTRPATTPTSLPAQHKIASVYPDFRAITTMLSPRAPADNSSVASFVCVNGADLRISESVSDSTPSVSVSAGPRSLIL